MSVDFVRLEKLAADKRIVSLNKLIDELKENSEENKEDIATALRLLKIAKNQVEIRTSKRDNLEDALETDEKEDLKKPDDKPLDALLDDIEVRDKRLQEERGVSKAYAAAGPSAYTQQTSAYENTSIKPADDRANAQYRSEQKEQQEVQRDKPYQQEKTFKSTSEELQDQMYGNDPGSAYKN